MWLVWWIIDRNNKSLQCCDCPTKRHCSSSWHNSSPIGNCTRCTKPRPQTGFPSFQNTELWVGNGELTKPASLQQNERAGTAHSPRDFGAIFSYCSELIGNTQANILIGLLTLCAFIRTFITTTVLNSCSTNVIWNTLNTCCSLTQTPVQAEYGNNFSHQLNGSLLFIIKNNTEISCCPPTAFPGL